MTKQGALYHILIDTPTLKSVNNGGVPVLMISHLIQLGSLLQSRGFLDVSDYAISRSLRFFITSRSPTGMITSGNRGHHLNCEGAESTLSSQGLGAFSLQADHLSDSQKNQACICKKLRVTAHESGSVERSRSDGRLSRGRFDEVRGLKGYYLHRLR